MLIDEALSVRKAQRFLMKSQYWPREEIDRHQNRKLRLLVRNAYDNVPYYHEALRKLNLRPEDIRTKSDIIKLPILRKSDLRGNLDRMLASNLKALAMPSQTGGSTGEPLKFYTQKETWKWTTAARYRAWSWCGYEPGDRMVELWGTPFEIKELERFSAKLRNTLLRKMTLNCFTMSDESMAEYARQMQAFKPKVLRGFTSAVYLFAKYVSEHRIKGIQPKSVITTAENLYDFQRKKIEETFGCPVYDGYGSRETSLSAQQCEAKDGYHISEENSIVEFLKDGEPVSPGESGDIVITDLHNQVMPWIRYSIEDVGRPAGEKCSCGRTLSMIKSIEGRIHDIIVTPDGRRVPGEFFPHLFKDVTGIKEYQIYQGSKDGLSVFIVRDSAFSEKEASYLLRHMREYLGSQIAIEMKYVDEIAKSPSGKRRFTISAVSPDN